VLNSLVDNKILTMMQKTADDAAFRHNLLANNLANVNTPGYKRLDTADFGKALSEALNKDSFRAKVSEPGHIDFGRKHLDEVTSEMIVQEQTRFRNDGSSVDVDLEAAEMAKNGMRYQMVGQRIRGYFRSYRELLDRE